MDLVSLLVLVIVAGLAYYIVTLLPLPAPLKNIAVIVVLLVFLVYLLQHFGVVI